MKETLLDRKPPPEYIEEWTALLQREMVLEHEGDELSFVIFRLANEWLALATAVFSEIAHVRTLHRIPHRRHVILRGLINLRGRLSLSFSLHQLLQIEEGENPSYARFVAIRKGEEAWTFPVDEVYGNQRIHKSEFMNVPVTVAKSSANFLRGVVNWEGKSVGVLDEELLFQSLKRCLL